MCGFFGVVGPAAETVSPERALAALRHRGPDAEGVHREPGVLLGHTRLAVIELSALGAQPMRDGGLTLVFNGEIYNHRELQRTLSDEGRVFHSRSDTEVILHAYKKHGERCVHALDGMFAFALWDTERQRLLLARDRPGKKPLFYAEHAGSFYFASEQRALECLGVPLEIDVSALGSLLVLGYVPAPGTLHRGVRQLEPGTQLVRAAGPLRTQRYWRSPFSSAPRPIAERAALHETRALVEAAVERRLEAEVPLGAFLSGGIDSTIVVGVMQRKLGQRVKTFSIGFSGDPRYDETHFARIAARAFDTDHTEFEVDARPASDLIDALVAAHDGPFGDSSAIPTWIVSRLTRQHVTVALTGDGGDELFGGYTRFHAAAAAQALPRALAQPLHALAHRLPEGAHPKDVYARAVRFARRATLPLGDRLLAWCAYFVDDLTAVLRPEIGADLEAPWRFSRTHTPQDRSALQAALAHNFSTYLPYDLLVKADRASMAHGLELRSPFLDTALVQHASALPDGFRRRGLVTKWILREAFADLLPEAIRTRGKMGFGVPLGAWFRGPWRGLLRERLHPGARCMRWLEPTYVDRLIDEHLRSVADHGQRLWLLLTLEAWLWR